jgi:hypothetical protein
MTQPQTPDRLPAEHAAANSVPVSGRALQPILWDVIERWHKHEATIENWQDAIEAVAIRHAPGWPALVERLQLINTFQWHEEDKSRDRVAEDALLAQVKRSIDASNARRVRTIDELDEMIYRGFESAGALADDAPLHSESIGSIMDRATVLALKIYHLKEVLASERTQPPAQSVAASGADTRLHQLYGRLRTTTEQLVDLTECLDHLLADIRGGRRRIKLYRQVKIYGDTMSTDHGMQTE